MKNLSRIKKKATLITKLCFYFAVSKIQRWTRRIQAYNDVCPISYVMVSYPCWGFKSGKKRTYYNFPILIEYLASSGVFKDPMSRQEITKQHIKELRKIQKSFPNLSSIDIQNIYNSKQRYEIERELDEQISNLEDNFRSIVAELLMDLNSLVHFTNETDLDVNIFLTPRIYDLKMCSGILKNLCDQTHTIVMNWAISSIKMLKFENTIIEEIQNSIVEFIENDFESDYFMDTIDD